MKQWKPTNNPNATHDPYRTLFVSRLSKDTNAKHLKRVFEEYGAIKNLVLIHDTKTGKSRNYAFIEYENIKDFKGTHFLLILPLDAYKKADGKRIDGKKVLVDYERGRTIEDWRPRRFGGGKGETRKSRDVDDKVRRIIREEEDDELLKPEDENEVPGKTDHVEYNLT